MIFFNIVVKEKLFLNYQEEEHLVFYETSRI